jgi:hypothetical protein
MIGAFARMLSDPPLPAIIDAITTEIPVRQAENAEAARRAFDRVRLAT